MKKYLLTVCAALLFSLGLQGQYNETIRTARPGQAVGPFTTGKYVFQVQSGVTFSEFENNGLTEEGQHTLFFNSLRYELLEHFELRSAFGFSRNEHTSETMETFTTEGLSVWNVGVRYNIVDGKGSKPSFGFQTDVKLNWVDEDFKSEDLAPRFMLIHGQSISKTFRLTTNWAITWNGNDNSSKGVYVINISFPLSPKLGSFIENYGEISDGNIDHRWDTGLSYSINNDLALDCSVGYGDNDGLTDWFVDAGISWRTKFK